MPTSAAEIITKFNADREPERLAVKMEIMHANVFSFLRGSAHLFWQRVREADIPAKAPAAWCSGDLHLENFGTYRGDNHLVYFDLNDFDEAALAPCDWEMLRFLTSILIAAPALGINKTDAKELAKSAAEVYRAELAAGKSRWIERKTAMGAIDELMSGLKKRTHIRMLDTRTIEKKGRRKLDPKNARMLPATSQQWHDLEKFTKALGKARGAEAFFKPLDCARRIAGTGSLGIQRYVVLIEGTGSPDGNVLLDLKAATHSTLAPATSIAQPEWRDEAMRITGVQHRCQAIAPALLAAVTFDGMPYVLKELQPSADRLDLQRIAKDRATLADVLTDMAKLTAWSQLRAAGRGGAVNADALMGFAETTPTLAKHLLASATDLAATALADYKDFHPLSMPSAAAKTVV